MCDLNPGADAPVCSRSASEKSSASCSSGSQVKKANLARPFISTRLEQWNYLDWVSNVGVRDLTFQLVLARLLDVEDPELSRALSRLVDLLTLSMVAEEDPLACQEETRVAFEQCKYWWKAPTNSQGQEGSYTSQCILYKSYYL